MRQRLDILHDVGTFWSRRSTITLLNSETESGISCRTPSSCTANITSCWTMSSCNSLPIRVRSCSCAIDQLSARCLEAPSSSELALGNVLRKDENPSSFSRAEISSHGRISHRSQVVAVLAIPTVFLGFQRLSVYATAVHLRPPFGEVREDFVVRTPQYL